MYGWVQLVAKGNSQDTHGPLPEDLATAPWEFDPIKITEDLNLPFTWFGAEPTLFDAPSWPGIERVDWVARSFLCYQDSPTFSKHPKPIAAFEWGYWMDDYKPYVKEVKVIGLDVWNDHVDMLRRKFPGWTFAAIDK